MCYQVYAHGTTEFFFWAFEICDVKCYVILTSTLNASTTKHVESLNFKTKAKLEGSVWSHQSITQAISHPK